MPTLDKATGWLNSEPLGPDELRGRVVLVDFWTYTCINWLRTLSHVRSWAEKYKELGLVTVGVHTPEFPFERDVDNVRQAAKDLNVAYPIALDSDYGIWDAFANQYWPAVYIADAQGRIRHHHFGEGGYEECERIVQQLLREAGSDGVPDDLVSVAEAGFEAQADWANLDSPETYLGYAQGQNLASPSGPVPDRLNLNHWALSGDWTVERRACVLNGPDGQIVFRFHARDVHLVMGPRARESEVPFHVRLDGEAPGAAHGLDVDEQGRGTVIQQRLYQLVRKQGAITDQTIEISFAAPGIEAYVFTFG
jgi:thiol-disulfide isomerase/thioredoxin